MKRPSRRSHISAAVVLLSVGVGICLPVSSWRGVESSERVNAQPAAGGERSAEFKGNVKCFDCHEKPSSRRRTEFSFLTEAQFFRDQEKVEKEELKRIEPLATVSKLSLLDKHAEAYKVLGETELGKQMQEKLKIADYDKAKQCLSCHSNWLQNPRKDGTFHSLPNNFKDGVSCEACHGPSSLWEDPHADAEFRKLLPKTKQDKWKLVDVRNPIHRAEQCYSCHIGNVEQGKVVTHKMYAAGHPPLPGIELETFASAMPPHWRNIREKGHFQFRKEFIEANYGPDWNEAKIAKELPRTKSVLVGTVIAQREAVRLLWHMAEKKGPQHLNYRWPDLAAFDCAACHHDLRTSSWRQQRKAEPYALGRPALKAWPDALIFAVIQHLAKGNPALAERGRKKYASLIDELNIAAMKKPFGSADDIRDASDPLVKWLTAIANKVSSRACTNENAIRILKELCKTEDAFYPDFESARQIAWAIQVIYAEVDAGYPEFTPRKLPPSEKTDDDDVKVFQEWRDGNRKTAVDNAAKTLGIQEPGLVAMLALELRTGQQYLVEKELRRTLTAASKYHPDKFKKQLMLIHKKLER